MISCYRQGLLQPVTTLHSQLSRMPISHTYPNGEKQYENWRLFNITQYANFPNYFPVAQAVYPSPNCGSSKRLRLTFKFVQYRCHAWHRCEPVCKTWAMLSTLRAVPLLRLIYLVVQARIQNFQRKTALQIKLHSKCVQFDW